MLTHSGAAGAITQVSLLPRYEGRRPTVLVAVPEDIDGPLSSEAEATRRRGLVRDPER